MSELKATLWLIPCLPLAASVIIGLLGPRFLRGKSHWPCIVSIAAAFCVAFHAFLSLHHSGGEGHPFEAFTYATWFEVGPPTGAFLQATFGLRVDSLSIMMSCMITFIGTLIATFAAGYMHGDPGYPRFFSAVSLFIFAMTTLVLADNFMLLFLGWEGVGLCSYLLVGFWFEKPSAAAAARKAFLVTRIGDVGMFLGIMMVWFSYGYRLDYTSVFANIEQQKLAGTLDPTILLATCLLLFSGAVGKSAQFPLHVWLPDAMEGPTPVSALIHAATMVTAGVYLVARCTPMFILAPEAQLTVAVIGGITALLAALIALTQNDLKRVLAYSTLSQLGYMFMALGSGVIGGESLATFAVVAALFHLFTHAFFKALLFLSAGSVMHAMGNVIDMRRFSGLRSVLPRTHATFLCGALALSGFPLLSGFWSKDEILAAAWKASQVSPYYGSTYLLLFLVGMLTAALTAFYTFRAYFMTFWGELKVPPEAGSHGHADHGHDHAHGSHGHAHAPAVSHGHAEGQGVAHESPPIMTVPLMILAVFAVGVGFVLGPTHLFAHFLDKTPGFPKGEEAGSIMLMVVSSLFAVGGIALAYLMYVKQPDLPGLLARKVQACYQLSLNKFHFDELYDTFVLQPLEGFAQFCRAFDQYIVDGLVDLAGFLPRGLGSLFRPVQNGLVQFYALAMVLGLTVFLIAFVRSL